MPRFFCFALLALSLLVSGGCADSAVREKQGKIAEAIEKMSTPKHELFLYSLNPHDQRRFEGNLSENSDEVFHGFPILGRVEITSIQEKEELLGAFASGVRSSGGFEAACFDPRHGIRVIDGRETNDFVICFECLQVESYGFGSIQGFDTSRSPNSTFNKILDEYKIKKAE